MGMGCTCIAKGLRRISPRPSTNDMMVAAIQSIGVANFFEHDIITIRVTDHEEKVTLQIMGPVIPEQPSPRPPNWRPIWIRGMPEPSIDSCASESSLARSQWEFISSLLS